MPPFRHRGDGKIDNTSGVLRWAYLGRTYLQRYPERSYTDIMRVFTQIPLGYSKSEHVFLEIE